jgi:murein DD-endopeptidase MepM/ murein hydrolase activator NlpD
VAAVGARQDAEDALADLESAVSQQTLFVLEVENRLAAEAAAATDPAEAEAIAGRQAALQAALDEQVAAREAAEAAVAAEQARRAEEERARSMGTFICPVDGPVSFTDSWGAARSGGRSHKGTDMMADIGVPTVAPATGRVEHRGTSLGGMSWYVYGDDGHTYYGTHLSRYANEGVGRVNAGDLIGYVGDSGNAAGIPHLHFEYHPNGGSAINPYPRLDLACPDH